MRPLHRLLSGLLLCTAMQGAACKRERCPDIPADTGASSATAAILDGRPVTMDEVDRAAGHRLYELRRETLDQLLLARIVGPRAQAAGQTQEQYLRAQLAAKVPAVSEAEAAAWYAQNPDRVPRQHAGKPFAQVKDLIVNALTEQRRAAAEPRLREDLLAASGAQRFLGPPRVQRDATGPTRGPADAKVTLVVYADFQCSFCDQSRAVLQEVLRAYPTQVRLVFRDFPLDFHPHARKAAEAAHCAEDQGKFWEMHDWLFAHQTTLEPPRLKEAARTLQLAAEHFDRCLDEGAKADVVAEHLRAGKAAGVEATPTFFINGLMLAGVQPLARFREEIDRALQR